MKTNDMKSAFIFGSEDSLISTRDYIENSLGVLTRIWAIDLERLPKRFVPNAKGILLVSFENYENVLLEGQKFILEEQIDSTYWLDHYNEQGDIGYMRMAYALLGKREGDSMWCETKKLPKDILEYLKLMSKYLKTEVQQLYNMRDNALLIQSKSLAYDEQTELLNEFIKQEGVGPFEKIKKMTFTGKLLTDKTYPL